MPAPYRSRLLLPETLPFTDARERRWWYNYRGAGVLVLVSDTFDRADLGAVGTADTGQAWTAVIGLWGINGNAAYCPTSTAGGLATVDAGVADCTVQVTVSTKASTAPAGLSLRQVDAANWIRMAGNGTTMTLQKCVAGTISTVVSVTGLAFANGDVFRARLSGTTITMYLNGVQVGDPQTVTDHATATRHGLGLSAPSSAARWDNFLVTP